MVTQGGIWSERYTCTCKLVNGVNNCSGMLNVSYGVVGRNGGKGKLSVDVCISTRISNVVLSVAPPNVVGAWPMAIILWQHFECYYLFNGHIDSMKK